MAKVRKNKRSVIVVLVAVALCVSFAISLFSLVRDIKEIDKQIESVNLAAAEQNAENNALREQLYGNDKDDYIEGLAREEGYINPGERVYYDISVND